MLSVGVLQFLGASLTMTAVFSETASGRVFWQQIGLVAGLYLLLPVATLGLVNDGWAKYAVLLPPDVAQYWDAGIYAQLAIAPQCTAFYPLWPELLRWLGRPGTLTEALQWATAGSTVLFLAALPLARLTFEKIIRQPRLAFLAFFLYALGPNAIFHAIGYTESVFSVLSLGLLLTLTTIENRLRLGGVAAIALYSLLLGLTILMSLTRPILVPIWGAIALMSLLALMVRLPRRRFAAGPSSLQSVKTLWSAGVIGVGSLLGYGIYGRVCWQTVGDFWAPFHAQVDWGRSLALRPGLLLLPRSLLIDLHGLYLPLLLMAAIGWLYWGITRSRPDLRLVLPRSPWFYTLLVHPFLFTAGWVGLGHWGRSQVQGRSLLVDPRWEKYWGRFSVLFAIAFCGAHALINLLANSGHLYSTARHVFGTPFVFVGVGVLLAALNQPVLNRVTWGVGAIGVGLLAQQWWAFASNGWLG